MLMLYHSQRKCIVKKLNNSLIIAKCTKKIFVIFIAKVKKNSYTEQN